MESKVNVVLPGGSIVTSTSNDLTPDEMSSLIVKRQQFSVAYCEKKEWPTDASKLSWEQIFEIREQPEWKEGGTIISS